MNNSSNIVLFLLITVLCQWLFGWLVPLFITVIFSGFVFKSATGFKMFIWGIILNGYPVFKAYLSFPDTTRTIINNLSMVLGNIDATGMVLLTLLIPGILYSLAGLFSQTLSIIRYKLTS